MSAYVLATSDVLSAGRCSYVQVYYCTLEQMSMTFEIRPDKVFLETDILLITSELHLEQQLFD